MFMVKVFLSDFRVKKMIALLLFFFSVGKWLHGVHKMIIVKVFFFSLRLCELRQKKIVKLPIGKWLHHIY